MGGGGTVDEADTAAGGAVALLAAVADERRLQERGAGLCGRGEGVFVFPAVVLDLVGNGGGVLLDQAGDCLERHALSEAFLDLSAVFHGEVLVFLWIQFFSHLCGLLSGNLLPRLNSTTNGVSE